MANYATDSDLLTHVPDLNDHGVGSWLSELTLASADVLNKIKAAWWPHAINGRSLSGENYDYGLLIPTLDEANLNEAALLNYTCYRALGTYILPRLSNMVDKDGDSFTRRADFFRGREEEEWGVIQGLPLYDFNEDSTFEDTERRGPIPMRIYRA